MSYLDDGRGERAAEVALEAGRKQALPIIARSMTAKEISARNQSQAILILALLGLAITIFACLLIPGDGLEEIGDNLLRYGPFLAIAAAAVYFFARAHATRHSRYRDPQITVEVADDAITVRRPSEAHRIGYDEADLRIWVIHPSRSGPYFAGIALATPIGRLALDEREYCNGKEAAAAICVKVAALGRPLPEVPH